MKAVIPAAGLGTRFLPYTKAQPKEMLPLLDKPAIQYVVEEALQSQIRDILIVTGRTKRAIEDHFDVNPDLENYLRQKRLTKVLERLQHELEGARVAYIRQSRPLGNGHAVLSAESAIGDGPFAVLLGDDVLLSRTPCTRTLTESQTRLGASCIAVQRVPREQVCAYGMVVGEEVEDGLIKIEEIVEKPLPARVTSNLVTIGRYALSPEILSHLRRVKVRPGKELWLTDGLRSLLKSEDIYGYEFEGRRFDIGNKASWLRANMELGWSDPQYREVIREFIRWTSHQPVVGRKRQGDPPPK